MKTSSDYYEEDGKIVLTAAFHVKRGSCCGKGCRHCPYTKPHVKGNTKLEPPYDRPDTERPQAGGETTVLPS
jgi:hypothetical protein